MRRFFVILLMSVAAISVARAQNTPHPPPNLLLIVREEIKPGEMPAHALEAMRFVQVQKKANARLPENMRDGRLAMTPVAGNENEVSYLWAYDSFADFEAKHREADKLSTGVMRADFEQLPDARLHASQRDTLASYRPDLSYNVGGTDVATARFMSMQVIRLKPGHEDEYWAARKKILHAAFDKSGYKGSLAVFQVRGGMPGPAYIIFRPMKSLGDLDTNATVMRDAMAANADEWNKMADRSVVLNETTIYAFDPRLSVVSPDFAAHDTASPSFWNPTTTGQPANASSESGRKAVARRGVKQ
jgi:hypothetical protein